MKKNNQYMLQIIVFSIILCTGIVLFNDHTHAATDTIQIPKKYIKEEGKKSQKQTVIPLFEEKYVLEGIADQVTSYYYIPEEGVSEDANVALDISYSELLMEGSSLTVIMDEEPVKSIFLKEDKESMTIEIPLDKKMRAPGFHTIEIAYHGIVMENICVDDENKANWLTLRASSAITYDKKPLEEAVELKEFPHPFIRMNEKQETFGSIVVPNEADEQTLLAAFKLSSALHGNLSADDLMPIIYEKDIEFIDDHLIVVGEHSEWEDTIKELLGKTNNKLSEDEISFNSHLLQGNKEAQQLLVIDAYDSNVLQEKINFLTEDKYRKQLVGSEQIVRDLVVKEEGGSADTLSLKAFDMPAIQLSGNEQQSLHYFYQLPTYVDLQKEASLHLHMKASHTLMNTVEQDKEAELQVMINDVPHSVRIKDLKEQTDDGMYEVEIPVAGEVLQKQPYISIQFIGNGLRRGNYCEKPDNAAWIHVENTSYFSFSEQTDKEAIDFSSWPYPFVKSDESVNTAILYTNNGEEKTLASLQLLFNHLSRAGKTDAFELLPVEDLQKEKLEDRPVLFVGPYHGLTKAIDDSDQLLISPDEKGRPAIDTHGFMKDSAAYVSWVQASVWDKTEMMAVFSPMKEENKLALTDALITYLENTVNKTSVMIENEEGDIFTNENDMRTNESKVESTEGMEDVEETPLGQIFLYIVIGIIILSILVLVISLRVKRKKEGKNRRKES